jgi:hypothetical protein
MFDFVGSNVLERRMLSFTHSISDIPNCHLFHFSVVSVLFPLFSYDQWLEWLEWLELRIMMNRYNNPYSNHNILNINIFYINIENL